MQFVCLPHRYLAHVHRIAVSPGHRLAYMPVWLCYVCAHCVAYVVCVCACVAFSAGVVPLGVLNMPAMANEGWGEVGVGLPSGRQQGHLAPSRRALLLADLGSHHL